MTVWLGKVIGRVRIKKLLARGGMAEVCLGTHLTLERFHREAKVEAGLRYSNIVQIFDFDTIDRHPYIVTEYLRGPTLENYLRTLHDKGERSPLPQVARLLNELTEVGRYVESFDSPATHVHFDNLDDRNFEVSVLCKINALTMNVRNGPGTDFPSSQFIESGDTVEPVGRTADSQRLKTKLQAVTSRAGCSTQPVPAH